MKIEPVELESAVQLLNSEETVRRAEREIRKVKDVAQERCEVEECRGRFGQFRNMGGILAKPT